MFYTYIIQSETSGIIYIGQTNNLADRIYRHNHNRNKYTKNKGPWKLIYFREFNSRKDAVALEGKLKQFKNKKFLLEWIAKHAELEHPDFQSGGS